MRINESIADVIGIAKPGDVLVLRLRGGARCDDIAVSLERVRRHAPDLYIVVVDGETVDASVIDSEAVKEICRAHVGS